MSKSARLVLVLAMVSAFAACAKKEAPVEPVEPVTVEPTYTGKYK
ncbi:MAG: hypothetical protein ACK4IU_11670 [Tabrizicola flagellatus]|jgi:hypothetical protein|nr:hypothetical protein [Tabrizicola flagellatus]